MAKDKNIDIFFIQNNLLVSFDAIRIDTPTMPIFNTKFRVTLSSLFLRTLKN